MAERKKNSGPPGTRYPWLDVPTPTDRALQVYAFDPSTAARYSGNRDHRARALGEARPGSDRRARSRVVDYDAANKCYYPPVDLDDPLLLANDGLDPSESDPRFHQQMVYAIAARTIQMFEVALGRDIHWRRADRFGGSERERRRAAQDRTTSASSSSIRTRCRQANAYYSPQAHGILFGYFTANKTGQGRNLPGQRVFTCLSQDIIAHEVTHAVIDGIRTYFTEPTNPDVLAFHEGFADLCALFSHFSAQGRADRHDPAHRRAPLPDRACAGRAAGPAAASPAGQTPEIGAEMRADQSADRSSRMQFGQARGGGARPAVRPRHAAQLRRHPQERRRSALPRLDPGRRRVRRLLQRLHAPRRRPVPHLPRRRRASGHDDLPAPLAELLAGYASRDRRVLLPLCARALDYCPPVDLTFGDFLRALITVARDLDPADDDGVRDALMEAFRRARHLSRKRQLLLRRRAAPGRRCRSGDPAAGRAGLIFGSPNGLTSAEKDNNGDVLRDWADQAPRRAGPRSQPAGDRCRRSIPCSGPMDDGRLRVEMVVEIIQSRQAPFDPGVPEAGSLSVPRRRHADRRGAGR